MAPPGRLRAPLLATAAVQVALAVPASEPAPGPSLWPVPLSVSSGDGVREVAPSSDFFGHSVAGLVDPLLQAAFARYHALVFPHDTGRGLSTGRAPFLCLSLGHPFIERLLVHAWNGRGNGQYPELDTDESYTLEVPASGCTATVWAHTKYGVLRALETFSQLVKFDFDTGTYKIASLPLKIRDRPRFPHRGVMVDTSRHFLPLASLRAIIDTLPYAKLNVLHWHIVDLEAFPLESKLRPKLWDGAYSKLERYTQLDVRSIVEYARLRGVRVVVEFDTPGHAKSWCIGYPEVCPAPDCRMPLNVASNATFALIEDLLLEATGGRPGGGLFPDEFIHLGGDEVDTTCWTETPRIRTWLKARNFSAAEGYAYFVHRVATMAIKHGRRPIQWSEVYDRFGTALPKEYIVHVWKANTNVTEVVANGYNVLRNVGYNKHSWYLDNLDVMWDATYKNDPCANITDENLCKRVLGGHGEMWGETVDGSNLEQTVWPRMAAIAEKLWSPKAKTQDTNAALPRIRDFRCLLLERGVAAAPVGNKMARSAPPGPGSCYGDAGTVPTITFA